MVVPHPDLEGQSAHICEALEEKQRGVCFYAPKLNSLTSNAMGFTSRLSLDLSPWTVVSL
jgi:hypothetical protein